MHRLRSDNAGPPPLGKRPRYPTSYQRQQSFSGLPWPSRQNNRREWYVTKLSDVLGVKPDPQNREPPRLASKFGANSPRSRRPLKSFSAIRLPSSSDLTRMISSPSPPAFQLSNPSGVYLAIYFKLRHWCPPNPTLLSLRCLSNAS